MSDSEAASKRAHEVIILNETYDINLQQLDLTNNQLSSLPAEITNLINLKKLSLWNNKLSSLPRALILGGCFAVRLKFIFHVLFLG